MAAGLLYNMILNIIKIMYFNFIIFFYKKNIIKNSSINKEVECCILGNGPSLINDLNNNLTFFENRELIVVNAFSKSNYFEKLQPKYYVLIDPVFWNKNISVIHQKELEVLDLINEKVNWDLNLIVPFVAFKNLSNKFYKNKFITVYFYNHTIIKNNFSKQIRHRLYSHGIGTPIFQNVVSASMFNALNLNFRKIFLFGVEHSWIKNICVNKDNVVCLKEEHFYEIQNTLPVYDGNGNNYKLSKLLFDYANMFLGYTIIEEYAKYKNSIIYNMTPDSYIDAFVKKNYNEIS